MKTAARGVHEIWVPSTFSANAVARATDARVARMLLPVQPRKSRAVGFPAGSGFTFSAQRRIMKMGSSGRTCWASWSSSAKRFALARDRCWRSKRLDADRDPRHRSTRPWWTRRLTDPISPCATGAAERRVKSPAPGRADPVSCRSSEVMGPASVSLERWRWAFQRS